MNRKPDCRNTLTPEQKDEAYAMHANGLTWREVAEHFGKSDVKAFGDLIHKRVRRRAAALNAPKAARKLPPWTPAEKAILVKMAPTGCGAQAIADAIVAAIPDAPVRPVQAVRRYASDHGIPIARIPDSYRKDGDPSGHVLTPAAPYAKPEAVFAGVSFAAPPGRQIRGVARPVRTRGRIGLPPGRAAGGGMWSGGVVGSGDVS